MTIESQNQILNPADRLSRRLDNLFKRENKTPSPDTFDAYVFIDHRTEEVVRVARTDSTSSTVAGAISCRIYNEDFYDPALDSPLEAKTAEQYKQSINACLQGSIRGDHPNLGSLANGSIWICKKTGNSIDLISLKTASAFSFDESSGKVTGEIGNGARAAFGKNVKKPLLSVTRATGEEIQLVVPSSSLQNQLNKHSHFRNFFDEFRKRLRSTPFSGTSIQVNSLFRDGPAQARAMLSGRFNGSPESLAEFRRWFKTTYNQSASTVKAPRDIIFGTEWRSYPALEKALGDQYTKQIEAGMHKTGSGHSTLKAIDLKTNNQPYDNVLHMLDVLSEMKSAGFVASYNWEQVWDHEKGNRNVGLNLRRDRGVFAPTEHIHLSITAEPEGAVHEES